jgi:hypothetical protein
MSALDMTRYEIPKLNAKERAVYSCVIVLWGIAGIASSLAGGLIASFLFGLLIGLNMLPKGDWAVLASSLVLCGIIAAWWIADHRRDFMRRSALSVVNRLKKGPHDT